METQVTQPSSLIAVIGVCGDCNPERCESTMRRTRGVIGGLGCINRRPPEHWGVSCHSLSASSTEPPQLPLPLLWTSSASESAAVAAASAAVAGTSPPLLQPPPPPSLPTSQPLRTRPAASAAAAAASALPPPGRVHRRHGRSSDAAAAASALCGRLCHRRRCSRLLRRSRHCSHLRVHSRFRRRRCRLSLSCSHSRLLRPPPTPP